MKYLVYITGLLGLAAAIVLVVHQDWTAIRGAFDHAGWALLWLLPFHVLPLLLDVLGWRTLLAPRDPQRRAGVPFLFWVATVREACNRLLPVANIGGEIVGIRLVKWRGLDGAATAASVVIEVLLTLVSQYVFAALGILLLIGLTEHIGTLNSVIGALAASLPLPIALILLLRHGQLFSRLEAFATKLLGGPSRFTELLDGSRLDREVRDLYGRPLRLVVSCGWQVAGFVVGSFESWLALQLLGYPISPWDAIAIEAVTQSVRHIIFFVPAGLGVQEGGLVLFGGMIGLPADAAIALSLVKRAREVGFGVPALLSWQWAEAHRLHAGWRARRARVAADASDGQLPS
ncbi:lysylphosphatidylglycerol synthase domain-containing protein [Dyella sedimenti]|uniref:lysylphosphatidylglycerol synthase domain-containing protein n=1 Tax=Dyella sedimenti TaxID=2919947 RepID=UPI001FA94C4A|nr:lysylphosphatidylglycerol synthase domain-containing protein [Dyella sedimenti]